MTVWLCLHHDYQTGSSDGVSRRLIDFPWYWSLYTSEERQTIFSEFALISWEFSRLKETVSQERKLLFYIRCVAMHCKLVFQLDANLIEGELYNRLA